MYRFRTQGVCAQEILFDVEDNIVKNVRFIGGCMGNTQGVAKLVEGMHIDEVISRLDGIKCRPTTSCPDQLAQALKAVKEQQN